MCVGVCVCVFVCVCAAPYKGNMRVLPCVAAVLVGKQLSNSDFEPGLTNVVKSDEIR